MQSQCSVWIIIYINFNVIYKGQIEYVSHFKSGLFHWLYTLCNQWLFLTFAWMNTTLVRFVLHTTTLRLVRWIRWHCPPDTGFDIRTLTGWDWARYHSDTDSLNLLISEPWRFETEHAITQTQILWIFWYQNLDGLRQSTLPLRHRFSESFDIRTLTGWDWARYHSDTDSLNLLISEPWRLETEHATTQTQILWIFWYQNLDGLRLSTLPLRHRFSESFDIRTLTGWDWARYHSDTDSLNLLISEPWRVETEHATIQTQILWIFDIRTLTGWDWARYHSDTDSLNLLISEPWRVETEHATIQTQILWIFWYQNLDGLRLSTLPLRHRFSESLISEPWRVETEHATTQTQILWIFWYQNLDGLRLSTLPLRHRFSESLISEPWRVETKHAITQTQILWIFWYQNLDGLRLSTLSLRHRFSESFDIRTLTGWDWARYHSDTDSLNLWYQNLDGLRLSTLSLRHRFSESFDIRTLTGWDWARYHSDTDSLNLLISEPWRLETEHATTQTQILWIFWYQNLDGLRLSTLPFRHRFSESFDIRTLTAWDWARYHSDTDSLNLLISEPWRVETEHAITQTQILWIFWYQNLDGLRLSTLHLRHRFSESFDIRTLTGWDWARYHSDTDSLNLFKWAG